MDLIKQFNDYQNNFTHDYVRQWTVEHTEVPVFAITIYLVIVFQGRYVIKKPIPVKSLWTLWNLLLSIFSFFGMIHTLPHLYSNLMKNGFVATVCSDSLWFVDGPNGYWTFLFIYSKFPELIDTVFLVLQNKKPIFLHWFHHITVLLFCWHSYAFLASTGFWFCVMNYFVHTIMYFYYFLMSTSWQAAKKMCRKIAPLITTLQISQMVLGIVVTVTAAIEKFHYGNVCHANDSNIKLGLGMYVSYLILFVVLFYDKFVSKPSNSSKTNNNKSENKICSAEVSNDAAGFFHGKDEKKKTK